MLAVNGPHPRPRTAGRRLIGKAIRLGIGCFPVRDRAPGVCAYTLHQRIASVKAILPILISHIEADILVPDVMPPPCETHLSDRGGSIERRIHRRIVVDDVG